MDPRSAAAGISLFQNVISLFKSWRTVARTLELQITSLFPHLLPGRIEVLTCKIFSKLLLQFHGFIKDLVGLFVRLPSVHLPASRRRETPITATAPGEAHTFPTTI